jgi:outer membrane protein
MKAFKIIAALVIVTTLTVHVQAQNTYTLQQCVDSALKNNLNIRSADYDLKKAIEQKREAEASFLPQLNGSGSYQYYTKVPSQLIPSSLFGGGANLPKYITGSFTLPQTTQANAKLDQTLYSGQALIALKAAKANTDIYTVQVKSSQEDVAYNVGATYYNIQALMKKEELYKNNLDNSEKLIKATKLKLDNGIATKTDYNRLLVNRESINANLISTQGQLQEQLVELKFLMGKPLDLPISVNVDSGKNSLPDLMAGETARPERRTDIQLLEAQRAYDEIEKANIKAGFQPTLSLSGNLGTSGYNDHFNPFQNINGSWFGSSYFSLNLSIPIYDGGKKRSQIRQKNIELQQYDAKIELNKLQADKEVATAVINYNTNVVTLRSQYDNVKLADKIYVDRQLQFENGIVVNTRTSELDLKKAKGELLDNTEK